MNKDQGGRFLHPLKNHVILKHIFYCMNGFATLQDWKNVRLVCKLWHKETLNRWRSTAVLSFTADPGILGAPLTSHTSPRLFINELQNPDSPYKLREIPYQRYKFKEMTIKLPISSANSLASSFWTLVGPSIKHLALLNDFGGERKFGSHIIQFLINVTPNLESVKLDGWLYGSGFFATANLCHPNLKCLHLLRCGRTDLKLSTFPNLQELIIADSSDGILLEVIGANMDVEPAVILQHQQLGHSTIKRLDCIETRMGNEDSFRRIIPFVRFPSLEHFSVHLLTQLAYRYSEEDVRFLPTFVKNHRQTLKTLGILTTIDKTPPEVCPLATNLPELTEVRLWGNVVKTLGFLKFTPNLKLLHLDLYGEEKTAEMMEELWYNRRTDNNSIHINTQVVRSTVESGELLGVVLQKLEYFQLNCSLSSEDLQHLSGWMPNIKTVKTVVIPDTVSSICKRWPKLEQLTCLFGSVIEDENVTGNLEGKRLVALIDLKYLTSFHFNANCGTSTLTDACVANGFLKMMELTHLDICVSPEFSSAAESLLLERIQTVNVNRNYSANDMHANWKCCKNRGFHQNLNRFDSNYQPNSLAI